MATLIPTKEGYQTVIEECRQLFRQKMKDYGTAWRILRPPSLTDQIYIKANRIRTIQEKGVNKVGEDIRGEFIGIINYAVMALIQLELGPKEQSKMNVLEVMAMYDGKVNATYELMERKNHDYGEAWRDMRVSSLCDLILMKVLRTKQIEDNEGETIVSEGVDANYQDMLNYSVFALILMDQEGVEHG